AEAIVVATDAYRKWRDLTGAGSDKPSFFSKLFGGTLRQQIDDFISRGKYLVGAAKYYAEAAGIIANANAKVAAPAGARGPVGTAAAAVPAPAGARGPVGTGPQPPPPKGATVQQRNTWFDQMIARQQLRASLLTGYGPQIAAYQKVSAELSKQIAVTKDITRK